jgi:hypothetical protein
MVKLSLCLINSALCREDVWGTGGIGPPFLTSTLNDSCQLHAIAALPPVHIEYEAGWTPEQVWIVGKRGKSLALLGNRTLAAQFVARRYIGYRQ